jgi:electron transport complex protein RnfE
MNQAAPTDDTSFARRPAALAWLALCPLLATSTSPAGALGLGVAACAVFGLGGLAATALGRWLPHEVRQVAIATLVAGLAVAAARCLMVWLPEIHDALGRAAPLIAAAGILIVRADTSCWTQPDQGSLARVATAALGGLAALLAIGAIRALSEHGMQLAQRPAGGFLLLGLLLAAAGALRNRAAASRASDIVGETR